MERRRVGGDAKTHIYNNIIDMELRRNWVPVEDISRRVVNTKLSWAAIYPSLNVFAFPTHLF